MICQDISADVHVAAEYEEKFGRTRLINRTFGLLTNMLMINPILKMSSSVWFQ